MGIHRSRFAARGGSRAPALAAVLGSIALLATTGCPTVDLGDTPETIGRCNPRGGAEYFEAEIWPKFVRPTNTTNGCTKEGGCHIFGDGNLLGYEVNPVDFVANYRATLVHLDCGTPMRSPLLTKPLAGIEGHGGMDIFQMSAPEVQVFLDWFQ